MKKINDINGLLEELENGPAIDQSANEESVVDDSATKDTATEMDGEKSNVEVYPADEHDQTEEVEEIIVTEDMTDEQLKEALERAGYEGSAENIAYLREELTGGNEESVVDQEATKDAVEADNAEKENTDVYPSDEHTETEEVKDVVVEDALDIENPVETQAAEDGVTSDEPAETGTTDTAAPVEVEKLPTEDAADDATNPAEKTAEEVKDIIDGEDGLNKLLETLNRINSVLREEGPAIDQADNEEVKVDDVVKDETPANEDDAEKKNTDVYPSDEHDQTEEVKEVVVEACGAKKKTLKEEGPEIDQADNEEVKVDDVTKEETDSDADDAEKKNTDVYCDACHDEEKDVESVDIKEEGPAIDQADNEEVKVDDAATKDTVEADNAEKENTDVYPSDEHKEVEEVVEVVIEAVSLCRAKGLPATIQNITEAAKKLFESETITIEPSVAEEKKDDEDVEKTDTANPDPEKIVEPSDILTNTNESVKYNSLREACMLEEGYFKTDSITVNTSAEKIQKLTEQVSLILARESMDPLYDELLKNSIYASRLQEAINKKYASAAQTRVAMITEAKKQ